MTGGSRRWAGPALALALVMPVSGAVAAPSAVAATPGPSAGELRRMPTSMAALGDSITTGFNACGFFVDCPPRSWSTGQDPAVDSHRLRLRDLGARLSTAANLARKGSRVEALAGQAQRAVAGGFDYLTIEVGANDACRSKVEAMTPVEDFRRQLRAGLTEIREGLPGTRVLLASVPDVYRLWEVGKGSRLARLAWDKLNVCQALLERPTSRAAADVSRRKEVRERVIAYNEELAAACTQYGARCRYDQGAVFAARFTLSQLTRWDFFHPDKSGQHALAEASWRASFWS